MKICLREVSLDDSVTLHEWRNEPSIRAISINSENIEIGDHIDWLRGRIEKHKSDPFWMVLLDDQLAGYVRFDRILNIETTFEISILLDPVFRGQGAGAQVLSHSFSRIHEEFGGCTMIAQVRTSHLASLNIFLGLGFQPIAIENDFIKLSKRIKL